jgi:hypothetical protein
MQHGNNNIVVEIGSAHRRNTHQHYYKNKKICMSSEMIFFPVEYPFFIFLFLS